MTNILRIKPQFHAMGAIANYIQYRLLTVVIHNPKTLQPNHDLDDSLWSKSPNNICICDYNFGTKTLQSNNTMEMYIIQQRMLKHITMSLSIGDIILMPTQSKAFTIFQNNWDCGLLLQTRNLLHALDWFLGKTTNMCCGYTCGNWEIVWGYEVHDLDLTTPDRYT